MKHDNCAAPVEGGRRGIQVQREEQVGHGLHNVSTWLKKNNQISEIKPLSIKNRTQNNQEKNWKPMCVIVLKNNHTKEKRLFNLARTEAQIKQEAITKLHTM